MYRVELPHDLHVIAEKGFIDRDDVARLRLHVFGDGIVSPGEAGALFWLNECCAGGVAEWGAYFAQALTEHFVHYQWPQGYVDDAGADRLAGRILRDGRIPDANEFELLISIIEKSTSIPEQLVLFALGEVRATVFQGAGPTRRGVASQPGVITQGEVTIIERVIGTPTARGCPALTRAAAEILFDLNRKVAGASNPSRWSEIFVNAIAGYVLAGRVRQAGRPAHAPAVSTGPVARKTIEAQAGWLVGRIGAGAEFSDNERELLRFIGRQADQIDPALEALITRAA